MGLPDDFGGIICPIVTPFDEEGCIDDGALIALVEFLLASGIQGLMIGGSTGEGLLLSIEERKHLTEQVLLVAAGKCQVMAHVGCIDTAGTIELARHAQSLGVNAVSAIVPFFFTYDESSLTAHFRAAMSSVPELPFFIYSYPGNAKNDVSPEVVRRLRATMPNFVGMKVSSSDLNRVQEFIAAGGEGFSVLTGSDGLVLPGLSIGACGSVSGNANVFPRLFCELYQAFRSGDWATALAHQRRINQVRRVLFDGLHPAYLKAALAYRGLNGGRVRPPMRELTPDELEGLERALAGLDLE